MEKTTGSFRTTVRGLTVVALAVGAALAAAACEGSILGSDPGTGVSVLVLRGPLSPVEGEGQTNVEPVPGALVRVRQEVGSAGAERRTGEDGTVALLVLPGRYVVDATDCPGSLVLPPAVSIEVSRGAMKSIELHCDTGIR